jgi:hypothetical protein
MFRHSSGSWLTFEVDSVTPAADAVVVTKNTVFESWCECGCGRRFKDKDFKKHFEVIAAEGDQEFIHLEEGEGLMALFG